MCDDLIDQITDNCPEHIDPNLVADWLCENLDREGPWNRLTDERSKLSSMMSVNLGRLGSYTYDLRQQLYVTTNHATWLNLVCHSVIPILYEEIYNGD